MNSLNFDSDVLRRSIDIWKLLKLWGDKIGDLRFYPHLVESQYNDNCYYELLAQLFCKTIDSVECIELNEQNSKIADELFSFNDECYASFLDFGLSDPYVDDCSECDSDEADCNECKYFSEFLHSFDFCKIRFKSFLLEDNSHLDFNVIEALGELYASYKEVEWAYVGCKYDKKNAVMELLFYKFYDPRESYDYYVGFSFDDLVNFFKKSLQEL